MLGFYRNHTAASLPTLSLQGWRDAVLCVVTVCPSAECWRGGDVCGNDELVPSPSSHGTVRPGPGVRVSTTAFSVTAPQLPAAVCLHSTYVTRPEI